MTAYRLEWPTRADGLADRWLVVPDERAARREVARMLGRRRSAVPWVRVVATGPGGDVEDGFVTADALPSWPEGEALPRRVDGAELVAGPEIERVRVRALAALDVVLEWSTRHRVMSATAAEAVRLGFDAALLGVTPPVEPAAFRTSGRPG